MGLKENHKNGVFHGLLCGFEGANLVLAMGALPLDPALYRNKERAWGPHTRPHWGPCPLDPQSFQLLVVESVTS